MIQLDDPLSPRAQTTISRIQLTYSKRCGVDYAVIASCSACDSFASDALKALIDHADPFPHPLARRIYRDEVGKDLIPMNWPDRMRWLGDITDTHFLGTSAWQNFNWLLKVRNGLAHAQDGLTPRDRDGTGVLSVMAEISKRFDIGFRGHTFVFGPSSGGLVTNAASTLVREIDLAAHDAVPGLPLW